MEKLFTEFENTSKSEWLKKVEQDLKDKSLSSLNWQIDELTLSPFYHSEDFKSSLNAISREDNTWLITESICVNSNYAQSNKEALMGLKGGCTSLTFALSEMPSKDELDTLLDGVQLEWIYTEFGIGSSSMIEFGNLLSDFISKNKYDSKKVRGSLNSTLRDNDELEILRKSLPEFQVYNIISSEDSFTSELASILYKTQKILNSAASVNTAKAIKINTSTNDNYFGNIGKLRALRLLLENVFSTYGLNNIAPFIEVKVDPKNALQDKNYSIIQANTQAMAAVIGGADRLSIQSTKETAFGKRIARNINHLMLVESYMGRVNDPSAGSYFIEHLTEEICESAWGKFQEMVVR